MDASVFVSGGSVFLPETIRLGTIGGGTFGADFGAVFDLGVLAISNSRGRGGISTGHGAAFTEKAVT